MGDGGEELQMFTVGVWFRLPGKPIIGPTRTTIRRPYRLRQSRVLREPSVYKVTGLCDRYAAERM